MTEPTPKKPKKSNKEIFTWFQEYVPLNDPTKTIRALVLTTQNSPHLQYYLTHTATKIGNISNKIKKCRRSTKGHLTFHFRKNPNLQPFLVGDVIVETNPNEFESRDRRIFFQVHQLKMLYKNK